MDANPDYSPRLHLVREWFVEIGDDSLPWREIGLNGAGEPVLAGPDDRNYGFWLDTNMTLADFVGEPITREQFEDVWSGFQAQGFPSAPTPNRVPSAAPFIGLIIVSPPDQSHRCALARPALYCQGCPNLGRAFAHDT